MTQDTLSPLVDVKNLQIGARSPSGRLVEIIKDVSFTIAPGEIIALIGESGSGKTTIALSLLGYTREGCDFTGGEVYVDGTEIVRAGNKERASLRGVTVSYVPQSAAAAFNPSRKIMDQVVEISQIHGLSSRKDAEARAIELFRALALPDPEGIGQRYSHQLSGGQLQRLSAAMALIGNPKLVIFDEPTTALDVTTQIEVLHAFRSVMRKDGIAGVYVSHDLAVVAQVADRIIVLKGGELQEEGRTTSILHTPHHPYTRALLAAFEPVPHVPVSLPEPLGVKRPLLEVLSVSAGYGVKRNGQPAVKILDAVSFEIMRSKNLGVIGESGSGKSTLARVISGVLKPYAGDVVFDGKQLGASLRERQKEELRRIQFVFQLADTALNPRHSIHQIIGRPLEFFYGLKGDAQEKRVCELLDMVRLPAAMRHRLPGELSGGQKQRINLARALAAKPEMLLCDEITSALDTVVVAAVLDLLKELQRELGMTYLFISHDLSTIETICDETLVMKKGQVVEKLPTSNMLGAAQHPYSRLLISSVPKLDEHWLDRVVQDPSFHADA